MDKETRGFIEKILDGILNEEYYITEGMRWVLDEFLMSSPEDFTLGFVLGYYFRIAHFIVKRDRIRRTKTLKDATEKDTNEIKDMLKRRIPDIRLKINRELNR